jgi:hypothetical protein
LLDLIGIDCVYSVEAVSVGVTTKDPVLDAVGKLTRLKRLVLHSDRVEANGAADNWMINIGRLTALEAISLFELPITDAGLMHLKGLSRLKELDLRGTKITDGCISTLRGMGALKRLELSGTLVSFPASVELSHEISGAEIYNWPLRWGPGLPDDGSGNPAR